MNEKIGMYTEDEILEHLTEGEGRGFLGRSMYDAIFDKIHALKTEKEQLKQENARLKDKLTEIKKVIDGYMPNEHAMCKAFDEIEFILKEN